CNAQGDRDHHPDQQVELRQSGHGGPPRACAWTGSFKHSADERHSVDARQFCWDAVRTKCLGDFAPSPRMPMRSVRVRAVLVALLLAVSLPPAARADIPPGAEWRIVTAGEAVVGEKLQAGVSNLLPTDGRAGQWFADGAAIAGATTGGLVLTSEQLGAVIHF